MSAGERRDSQFEREVLEQPEALERLLSRGRAHVDALGDRIRSFRPRFVVIAARGSSDNAARYAMYLFGVRHGLATALASPSLVTRYRSTLRLDEALVCGVSQSGQSPDIVATVEHARRQGALTITLTNDTNSPLAQVADDCLALEAGEERAVAASKTYTNELLAFAMLSAAINRDAAAWDELAVLPDAVRETVAVGRSTADAVKRFRDAKSFAVLGRGFNMSTAHEIALKTMEMTYSLAHPFALPDFLHGPVAMMDSNLPIIVVATEGAIVEDIIEFFDTAHKRKAPLIVISNRDDALLAADVPLRVARTIPEWLSPVGAIVPGQFWALALAEARGLSPDSPRGLTKVTETE
jgi:glucosamine--fructose-6-phosphate aminotransferase (isomerizing)